MTDNNGKSATGKRKYHQKSKNGCLTCKKRRVKCDENRPSCNKCVHLKLVCGYTQDSGASISPHGSPTGANKAKLNSGSPTTASSPTSFSATGRHHSLLQMSPGLNSVSLILPNPSNLQSIPLQSSISSPSSPPLNEYPSTKSRARSSHISQESDAAHEPPFKRVKQEDDKRPTMASLLNAGNLNNINLSHLVHSLTELGGDLSTLGNLASLTNLATLAQLPIDISNLGTLIDSQLHNSYNKEKDSMGHNTSNNSGGGDNVNGTTGASSRATHTNPSVNSDINDTEHDDNPAAADTNAGSSEPKPKIPNISPNVLQPFADPMTTAMESGNLNMLDLRLMFHYTSQVASTITGAGISDTNIWNYDIPMLAFDHPFLMHSILAFSATHLSRTEKGLDQCVTYHRGDALRLLREAVLDINSDNTDALVASALILIMDSLANASFPSSTSPKSLPASAWIFHVKGAATILTAVWPLTETSRFYKFISVDLGDLGDIINQKVHLNKETLTDKTDKFLTDLKCHDSDIADLFPVSIDSPYLITLAYLNKLHNERYKSDFILRIFAFPALLDKQFLLLLMSGDIKAMRIMRSYYKLLRSFTTEMKDKVWFLEGVSNILPVDVEEYAGGAGGMHMMLDFLGGGPSIVDNEIDDEIAKFDSSNLTNKLVDTNYLPSDITSDLEIMQAADTFMNMK